MATESDGSIEFLRAEVNRLQRAVEAANAEAKKYRLAARKAREELAEAVRERDELAAGFEEIDARLQQLEADPEGPAKKIADLERQLLERDHRDTLRDLIADPELGLAKGVTPDKLAKLLDYTPEGTPDAAALRERVQGLRESDPYLFAPTQDAAQPGRAGQPAQRSAPAQPGPGASRGDRDTTLGGFTVRRSDASNPEWMQRNQAQLAEAVANGTVRWVD